MKTNTIYLLLLVFLVFGCSKDSDTGEPNDNGMLSGKLFFQNYDGHTSIALPSMTEVIWKTSRSWYDWDISLDGENILEMRDGRSDGMPDQVKFTYRRFAEEQAINEFYYRPINGGTVYISGTLSPDKSLFCIDPTFDEGFVVLSPQEGKIIAHIERINNEQVDRNSNSCWLPDNSLVITWKNALVRFPPPYTKGEIIKEFPNENFGQITADRQGTKLAMIYQKRIWILNLTTDEFYQATESQEREASPAFSPDGRFIVFGAGQTTIGVPGSVPSYQSYMKIVPVDGKTYQVDTDGHGVIPVIAAGEISSEALKGPVVWTE
ncbi:PD40 domain-containing protein [Sphingobacterium sp. DN00404]|uniref:PD40 domain-containing protein n=1 Tax=Sphingobacterium micropteri TaxID=2763501 RepID=A0ABR7YL72_9SPHI|nr:PD40 domain-containing protein [Sphingobacterium micropteri]MBD1432071.1 PD40 domain-containing protein [Sphingobacterium micropteri]